MNKILCGKCSKQQNKLYEERVELAHKLQEGLNECDCGRVLKVHNGRLYVEKEGKNPLHPSVIQFG